MSNGSVSFKKKGESRKAEVKSFTLPKSTIMIEGQKDSQAGEVDKGGERTLLFKKEELEKKRKVGDTKMR